MMIARVLTDSGPIYETRLPRKKETPIAVMSAASLGVFLRG